MTKEERIKNKNIKSRNHRKLQKYSDKFNVIFSFFLNSYRKGILTFGGDANVKNITFDISKEDAKFIFRLYENGQVKLHNKIYSRHNNILYGVILAKKSWGLFLDQWSDGISDGDFTLEEIVNEFTSNNIEIPESLLNDFKHKIEIKTHNKFKNQYELYIQSRK